MIVFAELAMKGEEHAEFNSAFIRVCSFAKDEQIIIWGEKEHCNTVYEKFKNDGYQISLIKFLMPDIKGNTILRYVRILIKEIVTSFIFIKLLFYCKKHRVKTLYITSVMSFTHWFLKQILSFDFKVDVRLILHGEVERAVHTQNVYYNFLKKGLSISAPRFKYIVLAEAVKKNITTQFNLDPNEFIAIHHPCVYSNLNPVRKNTTGKITMATVGVHNKFVKESHLIFQLAEALTLVRTSFKTIGKFESDMPIYKGDKVDISLASNNMVSDELFDKALNEIDYIISFYPSNRYKFMVSGVFFQALKTGKPIIAIRNSFFDSYFSLLGNIGFLVDNLEEMKELIKKIDAGQVDDYDVQIKNIEIAREMLSLEVIKKQLAEQL